MFDEAQHKTSNVLWRHNFTDSSWSIESGNVSSVANTTANCGIKYTANANIVPQARENPEIVAHPLKSLLIMMGGADVHIGTLTFIIRLNFIL